MKENELKSEKSVDCFASGCYYGYHLASGGNFPTIGIYPLIVSLLVLFLGPIFVLLFVDFLVNVPYRKQLTQFCKEITKNTPSSDPHDWEVVAANLNSYFYENKAWNTKYFCSAMSCQEAFRTTAFSNPSLLKKTKLPRLSHLRIPSLTLKKHWEVYLQKLKTMEVV
ncbi:ADQ_G0022870.mRNA.1.CDS.1 [Saccharomyces cerevisiae]|nr:ADQ_G0022870.mRNA.1.CDS.1 [Saccharomyces cerevisiae]CAI6698113.1 ADQ_G0022870.mRNA.1.CDS.1 [Saccharomyces cerevisiae]